MNRIVIRALLLSAIFFSTAGGASAKNMNILTYPFKYEGSKEYSWIAAGLTDTVISDLNRISVVNVFSDDDRKKAVQEMSLAMTGLLDEESAVKVGKVLGANIIFTGSVQVSGKNIRINARLINVETTKVEKTIKLDGNIDGIFDLQDKVVLGLMGEASKINIADVKPVIIADKDKKRIEEKAKPSVTAYEWYSKGLEIEDRDPQTALTYYKKAIDISPDYTDALIEAGYVSGSIFNRFSEALGYLSSAEKIFIKRGETETEEYASLMNNIGIVYSCKGQPDRALEFYNKSKSTYDTLGLQNTNNYANLMMNIGIVYRNKGQLDRALESYNKSKSIRHNLGLQNTEGYASLMNNIGLVYWEKGQLDKALEYYNKSKSIRDNLGLQNTKGYAILMMNIGIVYADKGQLDKALEYFNKSKSKYDTLGLQNTSSYADLLYNIANLHGEKVNNKLSGENFRKAYNIYNSLGLKSMADRALNKAKRLGY